MTQHLDDSMIEALAAGRDDLVSERAHLEQCGECAERVELEREAIRDASVALRRAVPEIDDLDAMIARAMEAAPEPIAISASRRSLWIGAAVGGLAASALSLLSLPSAPSISGMSALGRQLLTLGRAADRVVDAQVPGGWGALAFVGLALALLLVVPLRMFLGGRGNAAGLATSALAAAIAITVPAWTARAYRVEGEWPEPQPRVTVNLEGRPTSEAVRVMAEAAGLSVVARLPDDPPVTLALRDVPIADAMQALLGDADVVVIPSATVITIRPDMTEETVNAVPPPPPVPAELPPLPDGLGDRMTFGDDVVIGRDETVRSVYTMGGDARIVGRAFGDVVTMGGDADILGEVVGNVTTMGGDVSVHDGARVHGDLGAMGGEIDVADGALVHGQVLHATDRSARRIVMRQSDDDRDEEGMTVLRWALWHALLFLLGVLMLGPGRERFRVLRAELADHPVRNALGGFFAMLAGIVLSAVLCVTIIGIPGAVVVAVVLFVGYCLGSAVAAYWLGSVLPIKALKNRPVLQLAIGVLILFLVGVMPTIGLLISIAVALAGLGAVMATRFGKEARNGKRRHVPTGPFASQR